MFSLLYDVRCLKIQADFMVAEPIIYADSRLMIMYLIVWDPSVSLLIMLIDLDDEVEAPHTIFNFCSFWFTNFFGHAKSY